MSVNEQINALGKKYEPYVIDMRRAVHRLAETASEEFKTRELIEKEARRLGLPVERVSTTGVIVTLDTKRPGNNIALRADIDALPMAENPSNMKFKRSVVSDNPNTCHACGHDAHTAMLLGSMKILCEIKASLAGKIYFCFEEGEEINSGWLGMVEALKPKNINSCWAIHCYSMLESGKISVDPGPRMGGAAGVYININGKGGHGSRPDLSRNPVFCAAAVLTNLATAFANQIDANETVTLGITTIKSDATVNVIADSASIVGSLRFFNRDEGLKALKITKSVATHTAAMNLCEADILPVTKILMEPTVNDEDASRFAKNALEDILEAGTVVECDRWFATECYAKYLERYKGVFAFLGVRNEEKGCCAEHHNEHFDIDEDALVTGVISTVKFAVEASQSEMIAKWGYTEPKELVEDEEAAITAPPPAAEAAAAPSGNSKYNLDSKIGELLKSKEAKAAVDSIVPGVINHPQIGFVKGMTLRKASKFLPDKFTAEIMEKIEKALSKIK